MTAGLAVRRFLGAALDLATVTAAFVAGYAFGARFGVPPGVAAGAIVVPLVARMALALASPAAGPTRGRPGGAVRDILARRLLAGALACAFGHWLGRINGRDPMPFMYGN